MPKMPQRPLPESLRGCILRAPMYQITTLDPWTLPKYRTITPSDDRVVGGGSSIVQDGGNDVLAASTNRLYCIERV